MLLRSSSAPILSSLLHYSKDSSYEPEHILQFPRAVSFLSLSQNMGEIELQNSSCPKKRNRVPHGSNVVKKQHSTKIKERNEGKVPQQKTCMRAKPEIQKLFQRHDVGNKDNGVQTSVMGGGMGSNGGWISGGCNGDGGRGSDSGNGRGWGNYHGRDRIDAYYQNMIEANPSGALFLGNYAKFLKEVIYFVLMAT